MAAARRRAGVLITTVAVAVIAVACGRATDMEIDAALGITPTATKTAGEMVTATEAAFARSTAEALSVESGTPFVDENVDLAALGNVTQGQTRALVACNLCHAVGKPGGVLAGPGSAAAGLTDQQIYDTIKLGTNHGPDVGGPDTPIKVTEQDIYNIIAFIRSKD